MSHKIVFNPMGEEVEAEDGDTVLESALENGIYIESNCGGNCGCSSCHVVIDEGYESLGEISEDEEIMLDMADGREEHSRLACQCEINKNLVVRVPDNECE